MTIRHIEFGPFSFDSANETLMRNGAVIPLGQKACALLRLLLEADGATVSKSALMDAAWPETAVEESNLTVQITALRRSLDDCGKEEGWITTVPRVGYRLTRRSRSRALRSGLPLGETAVAVVPFASLGVDEDQAQFANGLTDDLITDLSNVPGLRVFARSAALTARVSGTEGFQAARELGVRFLIEGSIRRSPDRLRINIQVVDTGSGALVWAERFDRQLSDVFTLQDEIASRVSSVLTGSLPTIRTRQRPGKIETYDLFVQGRSIVSQWSAGAAAARDVLHACVAIEPTFADAHAWLALAHHLAWLFAGEPAEPSRRLARDAAETALRLDDANADAHWSLGVVRAYQGELQAGISDCETALRINPNHADPWVFISELLVLQGRPEEGLRCLGHAFRLNPFPPPLYRWYLGFAQYAAGRDAEVVDNLSHPDVLEKGSRKILAAALARLGRIDEGRREAGEFMKAHPDFTISRWAENHPFQKPETREPFVRGYEIVGLPR